MAPGYCDRPELTAERLRPDPFSEIPGERLLRTCDLAMVLPTGGLELLGRAGQRGVIGGRSVHLGEIEAVLRRHVDVCDAAVEPWSESDGSTRLIAYVSVSQERPPDPGGLRSYLQRMLPEAMVPSAFVFLDAVPLTPDGEIDRDALPRPDALGAGLREALVAPRTPRELQLLQIWEDLFDIRPLGITDDFFALGGHSLLALRLRARVRSELGKDLSLTDLLGTPTIAGLAGLLDREDATGPPPALVAIRGQGSLPPLFAIHPEGGGVLCYVELAYLLGTQLPFYGLQAPGWQGESEPLSTIEQLASLYLSEIAAVQPHGPYRLLGWSFGGFVAYEMARRLAEAGEQVSLLAILDSGLPDQLKATPDDARFLRSVLGDDVLPTEDELRSVGDLEKQVEHVIALARSANRLPADFDLGRGRQLLKVRRAHRNAIYAFRPAPYPGRLVLLRSAETVARREADPTMGWGGLALGGVEVHDVPGTHSELIMRPWVRAVARQLGGYLRG